MTRRDISVKQYAGSSSRRWAWCKRMILRRADGVAYLNRLRIIQTPWFGVYLHRMDAPDPGVDLHDHPWPFASLVLRGGYHEYRADTRDAVIYADTAQQYWTCTPGVDNHRRLGSIQSLRLTECHTIHCLDRTPTWTLVFVGRRSRDWGFYVPSNVGVLGGWIDHQGYDQLGRRQFTYQEG